MMVFVPPAMFATMLVIGATVVAIFNAPSTASPNWHPTVVSLLSEAVWLVHAETSVMARAQGKKNLGVFMALYLHANAATCHASNILDQLIHVLH